jgi:hypothetical protein
MANVEHPYDYRRAVLSAQAAPSSVAAVPNLVDITREHAAAQGKIAAQSQAVKSDIAFGEKKLTEQDRQFTAKLGFDQQRFADKLALDREMLDTWGEQNKWATAIAVANLGVQALGIPAQAKTLEKREAAEKEIMALTKEGITLREAANIKAEAAAEQLRQDQKEQHRLTMDAINGNSRKKNPHYLSLPASGDTT